MEPSFDFERGLDPNVGQPSRPPADMPAAGRKNYRMTVCRHWLRGLCMKGNACGFLHQFEAARMPVCRFFSKYGECKEPDCPFKHSSDDIKDCNMYKLGFCIHGPQCRFRHFKQGGPPPPPEQAHSAVTRPGRPGWVGGGGDPMG